MKPAIAVLPYNVHRGAKLGAIDLNLLEWPLGRPDRLMNGLVSDLDRNDHLIVFPKTTTHLSPIWGTKAKVSILMVEPWQVHKRHYRLLRFSSWRFHRIFTHIQTALDRFSNAREVAAAETWVSEYQNLKIEKTKNLSLIASRQNQLEGHKLRHELVEMLRVSGADVDILGRGYQPFEEKADGLAPYRFSIITENVRNHSYFTEKIVDALLCETVPIYWGAPNIDRFFDPRGMIACKNAAEMFDAAGRADEKLYQEMKPALLHAKEQAIAHSNYKHAAALIIQNEL